MCHYLGIRRYLPHVVNPTYGLIKPPHFFMRREGSGSDAGADLGLLVATRESAPQSGEGGRHSKTPTRKGYGQGHKYAFL